MKSLVGFIGILLIVLLPFSSAHAVPVLDLTDSSVLNLVPFEIVDAGTYEATLSAVSGSFSILAGAVVDFPGFSNLVVLPSPGSTSFDATPGSFLAGVFAVGSGIYNFKVEAVPTTSAVMTPEPTSVLLLGSGLLGLGVWRLRRSRQ